MSNHLLRSTWSNTRAVLDRLGIDVSALAAELVELDRLVADAATVPAVDYAAVGEALVDCARTGADPLEDPRLIRATVSSAICDAAPGAVSAWADGRREELLRDAAPGILAALRDRVAQAQADITAARAKGVPLGALGEDHPVPTALATPAAQARDAIAAAELAVSTWRSLVDTLRLASDIRHERACVIAADLSVDEHEAIDRGQRKSVKPVVLAGHQLALPDDLDDYAARLARLEDGQRELAARRERERVAAESAHFRSR